MVYFTVEQIRCHKVWVPDYPEARPNTFYFNKPLFVPAFQALCIDGTLIVETFSTSDGEPVPPPGDGWQMVSDDLGHTTQWLKLASDGWRIVRLTNDDQMDLSCEYGMPKAA